MQRPLQQVEFLAKRLGASAPTRISLPPLEPHGGWTERTMTPLLGTPLFVALAD